MNHTQTIAMARGLLADGRAGDVARMLEPLVAPLPERVAGAVAEEQALLRCLLARVRLLHEGDPARAMALLHPFDASAVRERLTPAVRAEAALWLGWTHTWPDAATYDDACALTLLGDAEQHFRDALNAEGRCWALLGRARAYFTIDEYPLMRRVLREAAALQETVQDAQAALWMLDLQTLAARFEGRYAHAQAHAEALYAQARQADDAFTQGRAYAYQAALAYDVGRPPAVIEEAAAEAAALLRRAAVEPGFALATASLARVGAARRRGAWDAADRRIDEALKAIGNQPAAAAAFMLQRARLDVARGRYAEAEARLHEVDAQTHPLQHRLVASSAALAWCNLLQRQDRFAEAQTGAERAFAISRETGHPAQQLRALLALAQVSLAQGREAQALHYLGETQPYSGFFSVLPVAALRSSLLGDLENAEHNADDARAYYAQARAAYTLIGDVYGTAQIQVKEAVLERAVRPEQARALLDDALRTFEQVQARPDAAGVHALCEADPTPMQPEREAEETALGAALARASLSVDLIAEAWLKAVECLLPDRWVGVYRCDEGRPWTCVQERGERPALPPRLAEPCSVQLFADDVLWLRLRGHPGPAFFFGVALPHRDDPAWEAAYSRLKPWLPVAALAFDHALLRARQLDALESPDGPASHDLGLLPEAFVYAGPAMREVVGQIHRIRASNSPVLLTGERGAGKERAARAIHATSKRKDGPFRVFHDAGVADEDFESALRAADQGTLYLDEVGDLTPDVQRRLLRFLQEGHILSDGAGQPTPVNARIVAASRRELKALIREGRFLEDLYYRLNVIPLHVPPLRERREEIPLLIRHFMNELRPPDAPLPSLTNRAAEALLRYTWPGNVRQLRNEVERLLVLTAREPAPLIDLDDLAPAIVEAATGPAAMLTEAQASLLPPDLDLDRVLAGTEKTLIERVLAEHEGQVTASANTLGLSRQGLYKKMKRLGIEASKFHPDAARETSK